MLSNKWHGGKVSWKNIGPFPWSNIKEFSGIVPIPVVLDQKIGSEVALYIFDYTSFSQKVASLDPLSMHLKNGIARCPSGLVYVNVFWIKNPQNIEEPFAIYEHITNPSDPEAMRLFWDLARQTHWHVFVVGENDEVLNFCEFKNEFDLHESLESLMQVLPDFPTKDFDKAKMEFQELYSLQDFLNIDTEI